MLVTGKIKEYKNSGSLFPVELKDLFEAKRAFWIIGAPKGQTRGKHAHTNCRQLYICIQGEIAIEAVYAGTKETCTLHPGEYAVINKNVWSSEKYMTGKDILFVLASESYDTSDYVSSPFEERSNEEITVVGSGNFAKEICRTFGIAPTEFIGKEPGNLLGVPVSDRAANPHSRIFMAIQISGYRKKMYSAAKIPAESYDSLIHPLSRIDGTARIGRGAVVMQNSDVGNDVYTGSFPVMDKASIVGHDTVLGNFVTIAPAAVVSGHCKIGDETYIGANSCIKENISICGGVTVGAGSVVVKNIGIPGKYAGIPAKLLEK